MSGSKTKEERQFYIKLCIKENYSKRELEKKLREITMLNDSQDDE